MPSSRRDRTSHIAKLSNSKLSRPYAEPTIRPESSEYQRDSVDSDHFYYYYASAYQNTDDHAAISEILDEPLDRHFQSGDRVWVRTQEKNWRLGKVVKNQTRTRPLTRDEHQNAEYYQVQFGANGKFNTRKYFCPLNGEMKPDTCTTRKLLQAGGWSDGALDLEPVSDQS